MLFSELYSAYYNAVAAILREAVSRPLPAATIREIARKNAFGESFVRIEEALTNGDWPLLHSDGSAVLRNAPDMPLSTLEKRWLKAISLDPRIRLFGDRFPDFPEVEPLFTEEDFTVFDKYADGDDYTDEGYIARFRLILQAIGKGEVLHFEVPNRTGTISRFDALPRSLEYSEKDDKFRLITSGCRYASVVNLGRIVSCSVSTSEWRPAARGERCREEQTLVLEVTDERNALERVLLHFAHFEKETEKTGERTYRVSLQYESADETEIVIRVLSFGPMVKVLAPQGLVAQIRKRLRLQKKCGLTDTAESE